MTILGRTGLATTAGVLGINPGAPLVCSHIAYKLKCKISRWTGFDGLRDRLGSGNVNSDFRLGKPQMVGPFSCDNRDNCLCPVGFSLAMVELAEWRALNENRAGEKWARHPPACAGGIRGDGVLLNFSVL